MFIMYSFNIVPYLSNDEEETDLEKYFIEAVTLSLGNLNTNGI